MDKFYYICNYKKRIADGKCSGSGCKYLKKGECERTSDEAYAKNKFQRENFKFVVHYTQGDLDIYSEQNRKGEFI